MTNLEQSLIFLENIKCEKVSLKADRNSLLSSIEVICWDDDISSVRKIATEIIVKFKRHRKPYMNGVAVGFVETENITLELKGPTVFVVETLKEISVIGE